MNQHELRQAYTYLKNFAYFENINLFLKQQVSDFEFDLLRSNKSFSSIASCLFTEGIDDNNLFELLLKKVDFKLFAKDVESTDALGSKGFITNERNAETYNVKRVNYFFDGPTELWLIDVLWTLYVGPILDQKFTKDCYGNRLKATPLSSISPSNSNDSKSIFENYITQYNTWRSGAIDTAKRISTEGDDVAILTLDIKQYYYNVDMKFSLIEDEIKTALSDVDVDKLENALLLTRLLERIYKKYHKQVSPRLKHTHKECKDNLSLPIGLTSSTILANWYMSGFDQEVSSIVRPAYYGRYVDDIIFVFKRPQIDHENPVKSIIKNYFSTVINVDDIKIQVLSDSHLLPVQTKKMMLHYFSAAHSIAGLDVVIEAINQQSSEFKLLPDGNSKMNLSKFAEEFLYSGNEGQLKNALKATENEGSLSQYLSKQISLCQASTGNNQVEILLEVTKLFKGQNILHFFRVWEKVYQFAIVLKEHSIAVKFYRDLQVEIERIEAADIGDKRVQTAFVNRLRKDINHYNDLAFSMVIAALDIREPESDDAFEFLLHDSYFYRKKVTLEKELDNNYVYFNAAKFRLANLFKHYLVVWPLANYTDYKGDLTCQKSILSSKNLDLNNQKVQFTPRYIHFDEWQTFELFIHLSNDSKVDSWVDGLDGRYTLDTNNTISDFDINKDDSSNEKINTRHLKIGQNLNKKELKIALANFVVNEADIENSIRTDVPNNLSRNRLNNLNSMLNSAVKDDIELLVFPEVSIPVAWLPDVVHFSRINQIGLIFGLEHWVIGGTAYNLIIEVLPFESNGKYKSCAVIPRLKNHYAPAEKILLKTLRLNEPKPEKHSYHRVSWKGLSFSTYNCFELSDITHRILFKSKLDLLVACVFNKDTNYYQHILESTVRDLHCYTVQSNTSQYGGSCILQPSKTEKRVLLYVKGGNNCSILSSILDIEKLRLFHYKASASSVDNFKPLPPGFDHDGIKKR